MSRARGIHQSGAVPAAEVVAITLWTLITDGVVLRPLGATMALFAAGYVLAAVAASG